MGYTPIQTWDIMNMMGIKWDHGKCGLGNGDISRKVPGSNGDIIRLL